MQHDLGSRRPERQVRVGGILVRSFGRGRTQNRAPLSLTALPVGALRLWWRQGGSFDVEPFACGGVRLGAILGTQLRHGLVELGVAFPRGFRDKMPFEALDPVFRGALS